MQNNKTGMHIPNATKGHTKMSTSIEIDGRKLNVQLSTTANAALAQRDTPLLAEMELYFSCLIRKQVRFRDADANAGDDADTAATAITLVNDHLHIRFRPVMTRACGKDYDGDEPPLTDFPIVKAHAYVPHWLHIDFVRGQWQGEFGYCDD
jgi:hypothetical protein